PSKGLSVVWARTSGAKRTRTSARIFMDAHCVIPSVSEGTVWAGGAIHGPTHPHRSLAHARDDALVYSRVMCGINAIYAYRDTAPPVNRDELRATRECLRSRGPDAGEAWFSPGGRVGLGHRRLAIIDLSAAGAQPMHFGALTIIFNGEIYNYRE